MPSDGFTKRLRQVRRIMAWSQGELAAKVGLSRSFISEVESGISAPGSKFFKAISEKTDISVEWLLSGNGSPIIEKTWILGGQPGRMFPGGAKHTPEELKMMEEHKRAMEAAECFNLITENDTFRKLCLMAKELSDEDLQRLLKNFSDQKLIEKVRAEEAKKSTA